MSRRNKILIIAGILVIILILLLVWFLRDAVPGQGPTTQPEPVPVTSPISQEEEQAFVAERVQNAGVETVAKLFVERYGSYSTEAQFQNVRDVMPIATAAYAAELQAQIDSAPAPTEYYGVTTVILSVTTQADELTGNATATVSTQRTESKGSPQDRRVFYQTMEVSLEKEGGLWKVAGSTWK